MENTQPLVEGIDTLAPLRAIEAWALDEQSLADATATLTTLEAHWLLARGRVCHARFIVDHIVREDELVTFERALKLCLETADLRGAAEAEFWIGTFYQTARSDEDAALPHLHRAAELAKQVDDPLILSAVERHLAFHAAIVGNMETAEAHMVTSVNMRRDIGFMAGVASNLVAWAELVAEAGQPDRASDLLDEAASVAASAGAKGILPVIDDMRHRIR